MAFIVEMYHGVPDTPEFRHFSCHGDVWGAVLKLARSYGWKPLGTVPTKQSLSEWEKFGQFNADYEPDDIQYDKQILERDARSLADALVSVREALCQGKIKSGGPDRAVLLKDGMDAAEYQQANEGITESFLTQFIEFLRKGTFSFSWDD